MPVLDTIRKSLLGSGSGPRTFRCDECGADFSMTDVDDAVALECPFCGSEVVQSRA